jgi:hypothetical protein
MSWCFLDLSCPRGCRALRVPPTLPVKAPAVRAPAPRIVHSSSTSLDSAILTKCLGPSRYCSFTQSNDLKAGQEFFFRFWQ